MNAQPLIGIPSRGRIQANADALAGYGALCQKTGLVQLVEPEVLMKGTHTLRPVAMLRSSYCAASCRSLSRNRYSLRTNPQA